MILLRNIRNEIGSITKLIVECFTVKYFQFSGRSNRREYLIFYLFDTIIGFVIGCIFIHFYSNIYNLITIMPALALSVRRLHDINKTGWWCLTIVPMLLFFSFGFPLDPELLNVLETFNITPKTFLAAIIIFFILTLPASGVISLWLIICMFFLKERLALTNTESPL